MANYYGKEPSSDFFAHYGVEGMKWGVRKKVYEVKDRFNRSLQALPYRVTPQYREAKRKLIMMSESIGKDRRDPRDTTGRFGRGNIDLNKRKVVKNRNGSISTEQSFSVNLDGKETLLPTIVNGKKISEDDAIDWYYRTGQYLGQFDTIPEAEEYAQKLHNRQDWYYHQKNKLKKGK